MNSLLEQYYSIVKKVLPEKAAKPSVGLDIGTETCKLIVLTPHEDTFKILHWAIEPLDKIDPAVTVKKITSAMSIQSCKVATAVSGHGTLTRYIDMPKMSLEDVRQSVLLEADKHFPFDKGEIYTDCYILSEQGKDNKMPVLIAAAKKEIVDKKLQLLSRLGVQADFIGLDALAIANVFNVLQPPAGKKESPAADQAPGEPQPDVFAVLDIGHALSSLIIVKDGVPRFNRDMFIGGRDFTKRISNVLGTGIAEAEAAKCNPDDKLENILDPCDSILMNLVSEIRMSFDYFATEYNFPITKLLLTGGSSTLKGIEEFFHKNLDITVERWNPLDLFALPQETADEMQGHASRFAVALGLALYRND